MCTTRGPARGSGVRVGAATISASDFVLRVARRVALRDLRGRGRAALGRFTAQSEVIQVVDRARALDETTQCVRALRIRGAGARLAAGRGIVAAMRLCGRDYHRE